MAREFVILRQPPTPEEPIVKPENKWLSMFARPARPAGIRTVILTKKAMLRGKPAKCKTGIKSIAKTLTVFRAGKDKISLGGQDLRLAKFVNPDEKKGKEKTFYFPVAF
jgi:hypothetical protein